MKMGGSESKDTSQATQIVNEFVLAAESGDVTRLREVLMSGLPINAPGSGGYPALYGAIKKNKIDTVKALLDIDAIDVNVKETNSGKNVLMLACELSQNEMVSLLLSKKAKLNEKDIESEWSALHYAVYNDNLEATAALLEAGADINIQDCSNQTALHIACYKDFEQVAKILLEKGIDYNILDNEGLDAKQLAETESVRDLVLFYVNQRGESNLEPTV